MIRWRSPGGRPCVGGSCGGSGEAGRLLEEDGVAGGVIYSEETGRSNQTQRSLMANINIRF